MPYKNIDDKRKFQNEWKKAKNKKQRNRLLNILGFRCVKCFSTKNLQFHHIIPILRYLNNRYHICNLQIALNDFNKDSGSLCIYCDECHHEKDIHRNIETMKQ